MNFGRLTILTGFLMVILILLDQLFIRIPLFYFLITVIGYVSFSFAMSFCICSGFFMKVICHGDPGHPHISFTFDDGPDPEITPVILDILKKNGIQAVFFCIGKKIPGCEEILKRMDREGHLIGIHSYSHANGFDFFPSGKMKEEFDMTGKLIREITGKSPLLFRPPYGVINPLVKKALRDSNLAVIGYSNRSFDTSAKNEARILARFKKKLKPGDIVLLHDTIAGTAHVLQEIIDYTKQTGYRVIPLDELVNITAYEPS